MVKSKGPPYNNKPEERFVVIVKPWGVKPATQRKQFDIDVLGAWMRAAFGFDQLISQVEAVYTMSTVSL